MKLDDLLDADALDPVALDPVSGALIAFGFVAATYTGMTHPSGHHVGVITATRSDGTTTTWVGTGSTAQEAELDTFDALARWILNQPIPSTP